MTHAHPLLCPVCAQEVVCGYYNRRNLVVFRPCFCTISDSEYIKWVKSSVVLEQEIL